MIERSSSTLPCPQCRAEIAVDQICTAGDLTEEDPHMGFRTPSDQSHFSADQSNFPIWPVPVGTGSSPTTERYAYHAATQLTSGQLSLIVDPGAFTSLIGADLARKLAIRAKSSHKNIEQEAMPVPLDVAGVGDGSQKCHWQIKCDVAVPQADGPSQVRTWKAPIVEGKGANSCYC